jgi:hypothetical protein
MFVRGEVEQISGVGRLIIRGLVFIYSRPQIIKTKWISTEIDDAAHEYMNMSSLYYQSYYATGRNNRTAITQNNIKNVI